MQHPCPRSLQDQSPTSSRATHSRLFSSRIVCGATLRCSGATRFQLEPSKWQWTRGVYVWIMSTNMWLRPWLYNQQYVPRFLSPRLCMNPTISKQKWRRRSIPLSVALRLALPATNEWNHHESLEHMYIYIYRYRLYNKLYCLLCMFMVPGI